MGRPRLSLVLSLTRPPMSLRLLPVLALGLVLAACTDGEAPADPPPSIEPGTAPVGGPEGDVNAFDVRGVYLGVVFDSAAAVISHEAIPGFMGAMRMQLRVADRAELRGLRDGDKIRFRLTDPQGDGYTVSDITPLPPDTPLELADYGADGVPPEASLSDSAGTAP